MCPRVSIVINNYNYGRFVGEAIESALAQTYAHTEVVVVDDGSTDCSREVIARFSGHIRSLFKSNGGQASAFNAGFANCTGDAVIFLDSDDRLLPFTASRVAEAFRQHPALARVQYRMQVVDAEGRATGEMHPAEYVRLPNGDLGEALMKFNNFTWWPPTSGNALSRRVLERILPMPEREFRIAADYYLVRTSTLCGPVFSMEEPAGQYRLHGANHGHTGRLLPRSIRYELGLIRDSHAPIRAFAESIGLKQFPAAVDDVLDLRLLGLRMVSKKLEPRAHPVKNERLPVLAARGIRVSLAQRHIPALQRCLAAAWFPAMAVAPRKAAIRLGEWFFFPQSRKLLNRVMRQKSEDFHEQLEWSGAGGHPDHAGQV